MQPLAILTLLLSLTSTALALSIEDKADNIFTGTAPLSSPISDDDVLKAHDLEARALKARANLEARANFGWVGDYADSDDWCKGGWSTRPKLKKGCHAFSPSQGVVGVNYGQWPNSFANLCIYSDDSCKNQVSWMGPPTDGTGFRCVYKKTYSDTWGSVRTCDVPVN